MPAFLRPSGSPPLAPPPKTLVYAALVDGSERPDPSCAFSTFVRFPVTPHAKGFSFSSGVRSGTVLRPAVSYTLDRCRGFLLFANLNQ